MKCDEMEMLLSGYIDGEVSREEKQIVEDHLQVCDGCRATVTEFSRLHSLYQELERKEAPPWFRQRVTQRLETTPRFSVKWFSGRLSRFVYAFSFLGLVFLGGILFALHHTQPPTEQASPEVEVYAEDILFDPANDANDASDEIFPEEEIGAAEEILEMIDFTETETSSVDELAPSRHYAPHTFSRQYQRYI